MSIFIPTCWTQVNGLVNTPNHVEHRDGQFVVSITILRYRRDGGVLRQGRASANIGEAPRLADYSAGWLAVNFYTHICERL